MKTSDYVKLWRIKTKQKIIDSFEGKCCVCNYNKCNASLALHHLNPNEKEFSFGKIRANPKSWEKIVLELRKCVLVCHNCHSEIHYGSTKVPDNAPRFDENFSKYEKIFTNIEIKDKCKICGKDKLAINKFCSNICSGKANKKINWKAINLLELLELNKN